MEKKPNVFKAGVERVRLHDAYHNNVEQEQTGENILSKLALKLGLNCVIENRVSNGESWQ